MFLRHSEVSHHFCAVLNGFLKVLRHFEVFSWVLSDLERLPDIQKRHLTMWGDERRFHWFPMVL